MNVSSFSADNTFKVECTQINGENCSICSDCFTCTARILKTPCNHLFHVSCLKKWLQTSLLERNVEGCPLCRTKLNGAEEKIQKFENLLSKYGDCSSLVIANKAIEEWNEAETGYEGIIHFVELCMHNSQLSDVSQDVSILRKSINSMLIQGIVKREISIKGQPDMIRFEVAQKWLELCQQGSEAYTQRSPANKASAIDYIYANLQFGRQCGLDNQVDLLLTQLETLEAQETGLQLTNSSWCSVL